MKNYVNCIAFKVSVIQACVNLLLNYTNSKYTFANLVKIVMREGKVREGRMRDGRVREGRMREGRVREGRMREGRVNAINRDFCMYLL